LEWRKEDGDEPAEVLARSDVLLVPGSWSADGASLAYQKRGKDSRDLWVLRRSPQQSLERPFVATPAEERAPMFSPSGHSIAYVSNESGRDEVYVRPFPGPGQRYTVSNAGGV